LRLEKDGSYVPTFTSGGRVPLAADRSDDGTGCDVGEGFSGEDRVEGFSGEGSKSVMSMVEEFTSAFTLVGHRIF
jgi:hypothetical protein